MNDSETSPGEAAHGSNANQYADGRFSGGLTMARSKKDMNRDKQVARVKSLAYESGFNGSFVLLDYYVKKALDANLDELDAAAYALRSVGEHEEQRAHGDC